MIPWQEEEGSFAAEAREEEDLEVSSCWRRRRGWLWRLWSSGERERGLSEAEAVAGPTRKRRQQRKKERERERIETTIGVACC